MTGPIAALADRLAAAAPRGTRRLIALAGPPGAGKSTLAEALTAAVDARAGPALLMPMDGFHLDNRVLEARGLLPRKGAPETFDAAGFVHAVARLGAGEEVVLPTFDRDRDIAIAGATVVGADVRTVVVEGNYLLLRDAPWSRLADHWAASVFLSVPEAVLDARLVQRWRDHGMDEAAATARARGNDLPNASRVNADSAPGDVTLHWDPDLGDWRL